LLGPEEDPAREALKRLPANTHKELPENIRAKELGKSKREVLRKKRRKKEKKPRRHDKKNNDDMGKKKGQQDRVMACHKSLGVTEQR